MAKGAIQIGGKGNTVHLMGMGGMVNNGALTINRIDALADGGGLRWTFWTIRWSFYLCSWLAA
jgi:hypothetical protein